MFYDHRTNVAAYPAWQAWLQKKQPHTLVIWGKYDPSFQVAEAAAYKRDLPAAGLHIIDAGHFVPGSGAEQIADFIRSFLK